MLDRAHEVAEDVAQAGTWVEERAIVLWQSRRPVVTCCEVQRKILTESQLQRTENRVHRALMSILAGTCQLITCIEDPVVLLEHILGRCTQHLIFLIHDVGTEVVTQAQVLSNLVVTQEEERDVVLEVVFLRTAHIIIGNNLAPVLTRCADSRVTQTQVRGLNASAIVIESILSVELQPIGDVHIGTIVTEGTPTLITVLETMTHIVWVGILHIRTKPVAVQLVVGGIGLKIMQANVARNQKQLSHLTIQT